MPAASISSIDVSYAAEREVFSALGQSAAQVNSEQESSAQTSAEQASSAQTSAASQSFAQANSAQTSAEQTNTAQADAIQANTNKNKLTPSALPSEMNCIDGATFGYLNLQTLRDYCYSTGNFYFGVASYVGSGGADDFPGRNTDQVYYPTPLDSSGYVSQSGWDSSNESTQYEQIGDRYPAGAAAGMRIAYNMSVLLPPGQDPTQIGVWDKSTMRAACERGDAVNGLWMTAEDVDNPLIRDFNWDFVDPKPSTRMFSAICSHVNNPYSYEADDGICTAYTKIIDINVEQSTITMAFLANLGGDNGGQTCSQVAKFNVIPAKGYIELFKKSADEGVSAGNANYSLAGAEYGVYKDAACTQEVWRLVTNEDGWAKTGELDVGDYWVKEINASAGYHVDTSVKSLYIAPAQTVYVESFEKPKLGQIKLKKSSKSPKISDGNRCYSLADAVYGVYSDEACTAEVRRITTDEHGAGAATNLPLNTYWVKEITPSKGFALDLNVYRVVINDEAIYEVKSEEPAHNNPIEFMIQKHDSDFKDAKPQGDATLAGAEFSVKYYAGYYNSSNLPNEPMRQWVFKTDDAGKVTLDEAHKVSGPELYYSSKNAPCMPLGTVVIQEIKPPQGYLLGENKPYLQQITENKADPKVESVDVYKAPTFENPVIRGGIEIYKKDKEINTSEALGGKEHTSAKTHSTLSGIVFEITNKSPHDVYVEEQTYAPERVVKTLTTAWDDEHQAYRAATSTDCLPYGTYIITEVATNDSYLLSDGAPHEFSITKDGEFASFDNVFENQVVRNDLRLQKKADGSSQALSYVPFALTHTGTGETHILVTDENGYIDTANGLAKHTDATNSFDSLLLNYSVNAGDDAAVDGGGSAGGGSSGGGGGGSGGGADSAGSGGSDAGGGGSGGADSAGSGGGDAGGGGSGGDAAGLSDGAGESSSESGEHAASNGSATNNESASATSNALGATLTLSDVEKCISDGKTLTRSSIEACGQAGATGTWFGLGEHGNMAEVNNLLPALPYGEYLLYELPCEANKNLCLFSTQLRIYADVSVFARGYDLGTVIDYDKPQPPEIFTSATDKADGDKYISAGSNACVIDTVSYKNLEMGTTYRLEGTLMDKETGKPLTQQDGQGDEQKGKQRENKTVSATLEFKAPVTDGQIDVSYNFDSSNLAGKELVVFEKLYLGDELLVTHEDLEDSYQTVRVLSLETSARNGDVEGKEDAENRIVPAGNVRIVDTLMYKGLEAGRTYKALGTLMNKETEASLKTEEGDIVSAETEFVAEKEGSGNVEVAFSADTSDLAGKDVVVYEELYDDNGNEVLQHEDLTNKQQTVSVEEVPPTQETPPESFTPEPTPAVAQTQQESNHIIKTGDDLRKMILALVALALVALLVFRIALHWRAKEKDKLNQGDFF